MLLIAFAAAAAYFLFFSTPDNPRSATNANRVNLPGSDQQSQTALQNELDRQRATRIANAVNISPALSEHQKRTEDTERMMRQLTNASSQ